MKTKGFLVLITATAVLILAFALSMPWSADGPGIRTDVLLDNFARCLAEKGVIMYGAEWCSHCRNQKKEFGGSFRLVPYVECPAEPQKCLAAGITGYPTWVLPDGRKLEGKVGLEKLSEASGCPLLPA